MNKSALLQIFQGRNQPAGKTRPLHARRRRKPSRLGTVFEIQPEYVLGARLSKGSRQVAHIALGELEPGSISPLLALPNIARPEKVAAMVQGVARTLGGDKGPFGLLIPDSAVRVSILSFETLPANRKEQESLIRWKMKPLLPFPVEDGRLSFEVAPKEPEGMEVVVMAIRKSVAAEYESMAQALSGDVVTMLPTTAGLLPLLSDDATGGELLLHLSSGQMTAVAVGRHQIRLWRNQAMNGLSSGQRLAAVCEEAARTLAASHDNLGLEIRRVCLCARPSVSLEWVAELERALSREVESLVPDALVSGTKLSEEEGQLLSEYGATVSGLVANAV